MLVAVLLDLGIEFLAGVTTVSVLAFWLITETFVALAWVTEPPTVIRLTDVGTFFEVVCSWLLSLRWFSSGRDFFFVEMVAY